MTTVKTGLKKGEVMKIEDLEPVDRKERLQAAPGETVELPLGEDES